MSLADWPAWLTWAPLLPIAVTVGWHAKRRFHGFDWGITLSLLHRARYGQQPGRDYPSTVPALYVALCQLAGPWAKTWQRMWILRLAFLGLAYALLAMGLSGLGPTETLLVATAGALCLSGVYQVVWYSELTHLHVVAIALWSRNLPDSALEAIAFGAAGALLAFQRPNVAWVFGVAMATAVLLSWPGSDIGWAIAGACAATAVLHTWQPFYAVASLRRYFALGARARESVFFTPGLDVVTAVRWSLAYLGLAATAVWLILSNMGALLDWPTGDRIIGAGMVAAAFFGLKLSNDTKEPDQFLFALGLYWIAWTTPFGLGTPLVWIVLFGGLAASAAVSVVRVERTRLQTYVPLVHVPARELHALEAMFMRWGMVTDTVGSMRLGRDRYAAHGEALSPVGTGPFQGLLCGPRMQATLQEFDDGVARLGAGRTYVLGPDIEWLAFARDLPPAPHTPPAWHNGNMYLATDASAALDYFHEAADLVFVFTCKDRLKWMEYNYDRSILQFFETQLVLVYQTRWLMFFYRKESTLSQETIL